jgi:ubiquinol-cytochrome c reductase iron-sulfur subunit
MSDRGGDTTSGSTSRSPLIVVAFATTTGAAIALTVVYALGGQPQVEGSLLAVAFGGLGAGLVLWARDLVPEGTATQSRPELASPEAELEAEEADLEAGGIVTRRRFVLGSLGAAIGALGIAAVLPIRSLGPRPGNALAVTSWRRGSRVVTIDGTPVRAAEVPENGLVTIFPAGHTGSADSQAVLIRLPPGELDLSPKAAAGAPQGFVAYSKVCTHAGCPVGLYLAREHQLLCPCHQSAFDVRTGANPVLGPAARALPQLPLTIGADGILRALGDFPEPIGPAYWNRP